VPSFKVKFSGVTILQGVEISIFLLIFEWALQQCSAIALPVILWMIFHFVSTFVGVTGFQELAHETTYLETDLNTGECRDIAMKPKTSLSSTTKLPLPEYASDGVSTGLQSIGQTQRFPTQADSYVASSQSLLPEKSAAFGYHGSGNTQNVATSGYPTSGNTVVIGSHSGSPPVTGAGFPSATDQKFWSDKSRSEPRSGVYSVASSRPSVQQTVLKPGSEASNWAEQRIGPDAAKVESLHDDYQRRQVVSSHRENADGMQQSSDRKQLASNVPSLSTQVISLIFLQLMCISFET